MTERELLAAEHALRLLEGDEAEQARGLNATDPAFASDVLAWQGRLNPLLEEFEPVHPGADLWPRIERALGERGSGADVTALRRRVRRWQGISALVAAAAAALALVTVPTVLRQSAPVTSPPAQPQRRAPTLFASLGDPEVPGSVAIAFEPQAGELLVTATALEDETDRSRELWIIPAGGAPVSLGRLDPEQPFRRRLPTQVAAQFRTGATVAMSLEPLGGSPTRSPTGPVVATGILQAV